MGLSTQFEVVLFSFLFPILFMICFDQFNVVFINKKGKLIRLIFEIIFFLFFTVLFFFFLLKICNAKFNINIIFFLFLGLSFYIHVLKIHFLEYYDEINKKIQKKLTLIKLSYKAKCDRIKMYKRKKKNEKNSRPKRSSSKKE